ncbi:MAG: imidazoleglycerol-phosphate dehydratase, partial [Spirochaeta sp.]|nr:imidazoleglycerol-phosphate dehydratase [Spirochaeta sp.]
MMRETEITRKTRETDIVLRLGIADPGDAPSTDLHIATGVPFFDHMLTAMLFHGGFFADITASGDIDVDDHHTVEDVGIVLGTAFRRIVEEYGPIQRFGHGIVPMDDALGEVVVDAGGRSFLSYRATFPQDRAGQFDLSLVREFFQGLASQAHANIHVIG